MDFEIRRKRCLYIAILSMGAVLQAAALFVRADEAPALKVDWTIDPGKKEIECKIGNEGTASIQIVPALQVFRRTAAESPADPVLGRKGILYPFIEILDGLCADQPA